VKNVDRLREKLAEYEIEDYDYFAGFICLFANDPKWDALPEAVRAEILELAERQFNTMPNVSALELCSRPWRTSRLLLERSS